MPNVTQPPDSDPDPLPPPDVIPYFRLRVARYRRVAERFAAAEGLPPRRWPA
jgi:hypothetical protein